MKYFITAIGTDCGKTLISAIFCEKLKADYWKPIQTGNIFDSETIRDFVSFQIVIHPETYALNFPLSPHQAAKLEDKIISLEDFILPATTNDLIIEGAGGLLVPLNENGDFVLDFIEKENIGIVLVIRLYLGCINHALLSINELKRRNLTISGLVFNGLDDFGAVRIISRLSGLKTMLHVYHEEMITPQIIQQYSEKLHLNGN